MNFFVDTTHRSTKDELMDDLEMQGQLLRDTLDKIAVINKRLGGNSVTLNGLKQLIHRSNSKGAIKVVDLGCGNGDMLREIANYGRATNLKFELLGIDANEHTINYARELSNDYPEIRYQRMNVFSEAFDLVEYDIALATLFLHHFPKEEINLLLKKISGQTKLGVVVNDLHRNALAYYLFKIVSFFFGNAMVRHDGLLSILRGFKRHELEELGENLKFKSEIRWLWAFRYQWIILK